MKNKFFLVIVALFAGMQMSAQMPQPFGKNLRWRLTGDYLSIYGTGPMPDYEAYGANTPPWYEDKSDIRAVSFPEVTYIGKYAFFHYEKLDYVSFLYNSVDSIGDLAFASCTGLKNISLPKGLKKIGYYTFSHCTSLTVVGLPNTLITIGEDAFMECTSLKSIEIPNSVTSIGNNAFYKCTSLQSLSIGSGLTKIGGGAFLYCDNLITIKVAKGNPSFCAVKNVLYSKDMTELIKYPAGSDENSFVIPNTVTDIDFASFSGAKNLVSITIPNSVTDLGGWSFDNCDNLASFEVAADNPKYCSVDGVLFNKDKTTLIKYPMAKKGTVYTIPNTVTYISDDAFNGCKQLAAITIPSSVTRIGARAFYNCSSLTAMEISNNVTKIGGAAFAKCTSLSSVNIPNKITKIEGSTFSECSSLPSITIPNTVTSIERDAFEKCTSLTTITIPSSVTTLGYNVFGGCENLEKITIPSSVTDINKGGFFGSCNKLTIYTAAPIDIPNQFSSVRVVKCTQEQLLYYMSFSAYAKEFVEEAINKWQQKGEFERLNDWKQRVNEQKRSVKIRELLQQAEQNYTSFWTQKDKINLQLGLYDAENEVFRVSDAKYGTAYISVPYDDAPQFKSNWANKQVKSTYQIKDDEIKLATLDITMPNQKTYVYRNTDAVNYNLAEAEYNFAPIELNLASSATPQGKQNITTTKVSVGGKSEVDTEIPLTGAKNENTFVVIFANEDYKNVAPVPFAKNDGAVLQKYSQRTLGIPVSNIHYVENATFNDMRIQLAWLKNVCEKYEGQASVILYYTGHGIPDEAEKTSYILPVDGDGRFVATGYKLDDLYQRLGEMPTKSITVLLDACFSGATRDGKTVAQAKSVALKAKPGTPQGNTVVFSAAQGDETAGFYEEEGHGMFTYFLLKKLQETKGDITLSDLSQYVIREVGKKSAVSNKPQTPSIVAATDVANVWQSWKLK